MKKAISLLKITAIRNKPKDVLVVFDGSNDSRTLGDLITLAFHGKCPWDTFHIERKHESVYECPECQKHYKSESGVKSHFESKHDDKELPENFVSTFIESETDIKKPIQDYLKLHTKKILVISSRDYKQFISGIKDVRPLHYYES